MFPIYHQSGKAIAFGGRIFNSDDPAKYLNSPETPLYRKSEVFYGLHKTRDSIRKFSTAILVEGYTDFLQLVQLGIPNVVALSGTALGINHANQIRKFASKVYLAYDGDDAGVNATLRAGYVLFQAGVEPLVIPMPNDKDPDDWVREEGVSAFQEAMGSSMSLLLFHLQKKDVKNLSATDRSRTVKEILKEISLINDGIIRDDLLKSLSQELQLDEVEVFRLFNSQTGMKRVRADSEQSNTKDQPFTNTMQKAQLEIIRAIAFNFDEVYPSMKNIIDFQIFDEPILQKIGLLLIEDKKSKDLSAIIDQFENMDEKRLVSEILFDEVSSDDPQLIIKECFSTIKKKLIKDQIKQARIKIRELESSGKDTKEIIIQVTDLQKSLQALTENIETD
jgi:DNA primase